MQRERPDALSPRIHTVGQKRQLTDDCFAFVNQIKCCLLTSGEQRMRLALFACTGLIAIARPVTSATMQNTSGCIEQLIGDEECSS